MKINPAYVEALMAVVKKSPYAIHMAMELDHIELDGAEIVLHASACHKQTFGIVHGGVIATVIDTATFWAAFLRLPQDSGLVNIDLKLNYLQPVFEGRLLARGTCIKPGRSICYSEAKVFDRHENIIAHGTSTLKVLEQNGLQLGIEKFLEE